MGLTARELFHTVFCPSAERLRDPLATPGEKGRSCSNGCGCPVEDEASEISDLWGKTFLQVVWWLRRGASNKTRNEELGRQRVI